MRKKMNGNIVLDFGCVAAIKSFLNEYMRKQLIIRKLDEKKLLRIIDTENNCYDAQSFHYIHFFLFIQFLIYQ